MKKIIAFILCLSMLFCFVGCKEKEDNNSSAYDIDINYYLSAGMISEAKYALGVNPDDIEAEAEKQQDEHSHEGGDGHENVIEYQKFSNNEAYIVNGFYYCYKSGKEDKGIACIIGTDTVFGFTVGLASKYEVNSAIENMKPETSVASAKEFFYVPFEMENIEKLSVKNGKNILNFYFENDILVAVSMYNSENWVY
ncbi:MAG: hypothetical protein U0M42_00195 [Acutalibacteraceae bacterium]|nr:hypothetical protein [Acutalibacteraceae bacterium]